MYVKGELIDIIPANYNSDIPVGFCDDDAEDQRLFQLPKKQKKSKKKWTFKQSSLR